MGLLFYYGSLFFHFDDALFKRRTVTGLSDPYHAGLEAVELLGAFFIVDAFFARRNDACGHGIIPERLAETGGDLNSPLFRLGGHRARASLSGCGVFWVDVQDYARRRC